MTTTGSSTSRWANSACMARVTDPKSGRVMEVWSDQPGLQFYTGNFLDGTITGKGGEVYQHRMTPSAWSRSIIPIRRTSRISRPSNWIPARPITAPSFISSARNKSLLNESRKMTYE